MGHDVVESALRRPLSASVQALSAFPATINFAKRRRTILIVDEAQNLGAEALEELRMLSNINADKDQLLQIILVGQPQLKDMLRTPELLQFAQRVSSDFHLKPLGASDVVNYINFRLQGGRLPNISSLLTMLAG